MTCSFVTLGRSVWLEESEDLKGVDGRETYGGEEEEKRREREAWFSIYSCLSKEDMSAQTIDASFAGEQEN